MKKQPSMVIKIGAMDIDVFFIPGDGDAFGDFTYLQMPVTLQYRNWRNLTIDEVNKASYGKAYGDKPKLVPSKDFGIFSGILNRLPPEIRRAGRDVLGTIKRNIPIGKTTGGRVFPPFL